MDPSESMLVFLRTFNDALDKIRDHHISVDDKDGLVILYNSLPEFWKMEIVRFYDEDDLDRPLLECKLHIGVKWAKITGWTF